MKSPVTAWPLLARHFKAFCTISYDPQEQACHFWSNHGFDSAERTEAGKYILTLDKLHHLKDAFAPALIVATNEADDLVLTRAGAGSETIIEVWLWDGSGLEAEIPTQLVPKDYQFTLLVFEPSEAEFNPIP